MVAKPALHIYYTLELTIAKVPIQHLKCQTLCREIWIDILLFLKGRHSVKEELEVARSQQN